MNAPTPYAIRAEFEDLVMRDLQGPFAGADEVLADEPRPIDRYPLGGLAPRKSAEAPPVIDGAGNGTEDADALEDREPARTMLPSAVGLSFIVDPDATHLLVTASWGRYVREHVEVESAQDGEEKRKRSGRWRRMPIEVLQPIPLADSEIAEKVDPDNRAVLLRGRIRRERDAWFVTLFLVNEQLAPTNLEDEVWLFQAALAVETAPGAALFVDRATVLALDPATLDDDEERALALLYRDRADFAVGHGAAVAFEPLVSDGHRAKRLWTESMPRCEVERVDPPEADEYPLLATLELGMEALSRTADSDFAGTLGSLVTAYRAWLRDRVADLAADPELAPHQAAGSAHLEAARIAADRIDAGIALLGTDPLAAEAFRFANAAMWRQRVQQSLMRDGTRGEPHRWRLFQLAFVLLALPALTDPRHPDRSEPNPVLELLFFPTGGGKTEAYLGLAAYTMAIRRLQGTLQTDDGALDGRDGVAVLMRYTLRLLTAQQFQRAAALTAACEVLRRERSEAGDNRFGSVPFRLGLFIGGSATPNRTEEAHDAIARARAGGGGTGRYADPLKLERCPWSGHELLTERDVSADTARARTLFVCPDPHDCPFNARNSAGDGIPVVTVDEEIFRLIPAFVIATVDKFAQLPWQGALHTLFGHVYERCERHGYRSRAMPRIGAHEETSSHLESGRNPAAATVRVMRLRPPDLIIQDELHLIAGPLGTLVGLYEVAIDRLSRVTIEGRRCGPAMVASTATIRRAPQQVRELFARSVNVFPPPALSANDTFFAKGRKAGPKTPGRRYVGVCARGQRLKAIEARLAMTILAAAQSLFDRYGPLADAYMTLVGYFSAIRELAGMKRILEDEVRDRLPAAVGRGLGRRDPWLEVHELTSRISSEEILDVLARLETTFIAGERKKGDPRPLDVVLATNMISVGVDVQRLGLMMVVGQPKATAEYIQATSRVGRSHSGPGMIFTLYNWARPRDLSHYERFGHYHATFYRQVEPLSVTPFSERALDRGLTAVLVALVRQTFAADGALGPLTNPDAAAQSAPVTQPAIQALVADLERRAFAATSDAGRRDLVRDQTQRRLDQWFAIEQRQLRTTTSLSYSGKTRDTRALLDDGLKAGWTLWSAPNSLRDVEREINLLMDVATIPADAADEVEL